MVVAALLEGLQALTPDRVPNVEAALYGAGGTLIAVLLAALFIRVRKQSACQKGYSNSFTSDCCPTRDAIH